MSPSSSNKDLRWLGKRTAEDCYWNSNNTYPHRFYYTPTGLLRVLKCKQDSSPQKASTLDTIEAEKFIKFG